MCRLDGTSPAELAGGAKAWRQGLQALRLGAAANTWIHLLSYVVLMLRPTLAACTAQLQGKLVVLNEPRNGSQLVGNLSYFFRRAPDVPSDFKLYTLVFAPSATQPGSDLRTGDLVRLTVDLDLSGYIPEATTAGAAAAGTPGTLYVRQWVGLSLGGTTPTSSRVYYLGGSDPLSLRTVVWVVTNVCGQAVAPGGMTAQDVYNVFFGPPAGTALLPPGSPRPLTSSMALNRLWDSCSYGAVQLLRSDVIVLNMTLPCTGMRPNGAVWNLTASGAGCGTDELWGMMEHALLSSQQTGGLDLSTFYRRILVLPAPGALAAAAGAGASGGLPGGSVCPTWQHRGTFGCDDDMGCDVWLKADPAQLPGWIMTQLGASMLLRPALRPPPSVNTSTSSAASTATWTPTDPSDPEGAPAAEAGEYRCFNAPNSVKLLFSRATQPLDGSALVPAATVPLQLGPAANDAANILLVRPTWLATTTGGGTPLLLFGQYRAPVGGDSGLTSAVRGRLVVHGIAAGSATAAPPTGPVAAAPTRLLAVLAPGESYRYEFAKVLIRFRSLTPPPADDPGGVTGGSAEVAVCRYLTSSETGFDCFNGIDDDCDGKADAEDPGCQSLYGRHRRHHFML